MILSVWKTPGKISSHHSGLSSLSYHIRFEWSSSINASHHQLRSQQNYFEYSQCFHRCHRYRSDKAWYCREHGCHYVLWVLRRALCVRCIPLRIFTSKNLHNLQCWTCQSGFTQRRSTHYAWPIRPWNDCPCVLRKLVHRAFAELPGSGHASDSHGIDSYRLAL